MWQFWLLINIPQIRTLIQVPDQISKKMLYYCISKGKDLHNPNMFYEVNAENNLQWANSNKKRCISILSKRFKKLSMRICNQFFSFIMQTITNNITQFKFNDSSSCQIKKRKYPLLFSGGKYVYKYCQLVRKPLPLRLCTKASSTSK